MKATIPARSRTAIRLAFKSAGMALAALLAGNGGNGALQAQIAQVAPQPQASAAPARALAAPAPSTDWRDRPMTPGKWRWTPTSDVSSALYLSPSGRPLIALTCDFRSRRVWLRIPASGGPNGTPDVPVVVTTTSLQRLLSGRIESGSGASAVVALDARDPLLDAMAFSRGRFMIEAPGSQGYYLPSWTEISRVIEDCR